ncbi:MAG TPA: AcvB/VirJ family lysyl-phosphatidylglycerol hydrolase [Steroidobacteraceae bacterium]
MILRLGRWWWIAGILWWPLRGAAAPPPMLSSAPTSMTTSTATSAATPTSVTGLPLTVIPAAAGGHSPWFGVFLSGDGGWVAIDRRVADELAKHHIPIVGWDSLKYFWSRRTPQGAAQDLDRVVLHYAQKWHRTHVLLIGFSQGADTMPFMVNRLPAATRDMVGLMALLGISDSANFEIHVGNWLGAPPLGLPTAPELLGWSGPPYLCIYGAKDHDAACEEVTGNDGVVIKMPGGHHLRRRYAAVAAQIFRRLPVVPVVPVVPVALVSTSAH